MTDFVHWTMVYSNPRNYAEFKRAEEFLINFYKKQNNEKSS